MNDYTFGNKILELRTKLNLSQTELAEKIGVTNKAVSKWETGKSKPTTNANDAAKKEMERIEKYLLENRAVVDTYNDSTVRRLISSIEVTPELDLKIYIKGGYEITEKYFPLKNSA